MMCSVLFFQRRKMELAPKSKVKSFVSKVDKVESFSNMNDKVIPKDDDPHSHFLSISNDKVISKKFKFVVAFLDPECTACYHAFQMNINAT